MDKPRRLDDAEIAQLLQYRGGLADAIRATSKQASELVLFRHKDGTPAPDPCMEMCKRGD